MPYIYIKKKREYSTENPSFNVKFPISENKEFKIQIQLKSDHVIWTTTE